MIGFSCYYLALVPYTRNASSILLKPPQEMEVDSYERAVETNLYREFQPRYAYIAESYTRYVGYIVRERGIVGYLNRIVDIIAYIGYTAAVMSYL